MLKRSHRRTLVDLLIEALLIIFSVLVALAANRWRDEHEARQRLAAAGQHIRIELQDNRAILQNIIPYLATVQHASPERLFAGGLVGPFAACLWIAGFWHVHMNIRPEAAAFGRIMLAAF